MANGLPSWLLLETDRNDRHVHVSVFVGPDADHRALAGKLVLDHDQAADLAAMVALGRRRVERDATDPRQPGGGISGPGGPYDEDAVVIDTRNAVILEGCEVAIVGAVRQGVLDRKPITALVMRGRINKTPERVQALYLLNEDGAAGIVTELVGVAARAGWGSEFVDRVTARLDALP